MFGKWVALGSICELGLPGDEHRSFLIGTHHGNFRLCSRDHPTQRLDRQTIGVVILRDVKCNDRLESTMHERRKRIGRLRVAQMPHFRSDPFFQHARIRSR